MFGSVGPTFFAPARGDHTPGDGLTALQCAFTGASGADVSGNAVPVTQTGGTLANGYYEVNFTPGSTPNLGITWGGAGPLCARTDPGQAYTVEFLYKITRYVQANNDSTKGVILMDNLTSAMTGFTAPVRWYLRGGGFPLLQTYYSMPTYGNPANQALSVDVLQHIAFVWGTDNLCRVFLNGALLAGPIGPDYSEWASGTVTVGFIDPTAGTFGTDYTARYYGIRIRRAKMYADGGFTPPSSADDWGPP